jgi:hypothetical protein
MEPWRKQEPKTAAILKAHARGKAALRYGVRLNKKHLRAIVAAIRAGQAQLLSKQSLNRSLWKVELLGVPFYPVYDKRRGCVATFLTEAMVVDDGIPVDRLQDSY